MIKTPAEIDLYRVAGRCTDRAVASAWEISRAHDTEKQLSARIQSFGLELGADFAHHCQLQAGPHSAIAMAPSLDRPCAEGELVHVDYGGLFAGYVTDIARNAVVGKPATTQRSIYEKLLDIHRTLIAHVRPGVSAGEIWDLGSREFRRAGLTHPWSSLGHHVGLEVHEGFDITADSVEVFEPGMLINLEPSHFEPDGRYHIEDTLLLVPEGTELLTGPEATDDAALNHAIPVLRT